MWNQFICGQIIIQGGKKRGTGQGLVLGRLLAGGGGQLTVCGSAGIVDQNPITRLNLLPGGNGGRGAAGQNKGTEKSRRYQTHESTSQIRRGPLT